MTWLLVAFALALLGYGLLSGRPLATIVSPAMVFLFVGVAAGLIVDVEAGPDEIVLETLAEATLAVVLFTDAARIDLRSLRAGLDVPVRLLGVGLPLTIVAGALVALLVEPALLPLEAVVLAICLAPTDAALGQAVVSDERVPVRIRQGLNVESGLNDGICVPLLIVALALAAEEAQGGGLSAALSVLVAQLGWGTAAGVVAGVVGASVVRVAWRQGGDEGWRRIGGVATALLAYGLAVLLGGSGFIAAFVGGLAFGIVVRLGDRDPDEATELAEEVGSFLGAATFLMFGVSVIAPFADRIGPASIVIAVAALTVARMIPVAAAMVGSRAAPPTVWFLGWFGPRGLASIVFAVLVLHDGAELRGLPIIEQAIVATVVLSVVAHGLTAGPLAARYGAWFDRARASRPGLMEATSVPDQRPRWSPVFRRRLRTDPVPSTTPEDRADA